jgi:hypothetical protein
MNTRLSLLVCLIACGDALAVQDLTPDSIDARGGNVVTIHGAGFNASTSVQVDTLRASAVKVISDQELQVTVPALYAGTSSVVVTDEAATITMPKALQVLPLDLRYVQAPAYVIPAPANPITGAVAQDFDGDGDIDLVTCRTGELCRIVLNDGTGNFTDPVTGDAGVGTRFPGETLPTSVVTSADFDNDGDMDLFVGFGSSALGAFEVNDGKAMFSQSPLGTNAQVDPVTAVAVGDLDGDGKVDLVLGNTVADDVPLRVYFNRSTATSIVFADAPSGAVPSATWQVTNLALGDVDGDGHLDILMATPLASDGLGMHLFLGNGATFQAAPLEAANATVPTALAIADLTGDGAVDILAAGPGQDRLLVNDGTGHFFDATTAMMPLDDALATSIAIVDLDRDRHPDVLIGNSNDVTRVYINDGTGHFQDESPRLSLQPQKVITLIPADVDGDGADDIFIFTQDTILSLFLSVEPIK